MLQFSPDCPPVSTFAFNATASVSSPVAERKQQETQYELKPITMQFTHPLILESACNQTTCQVDAESMELRVALKHLFPEDSQIRELLLPILQGEEMTERRRLELKACIKYPHVLDLQEAYVKRALGEELTEFEALLLRRMDGAVDVEVSQQG
ncbi:MAG: hypothetical protein K2Y39_05720 [Candidatus Obscuribacterales bacterium]|nr:hypothetical protein [Candidatus Obscuribacterales bacterium]